MTTLKETAGLRFRKKNPGIKDTGIPDDSCIGRMNLLIYRLPCSILPDLTGGFLFLVFYCSNYIEYLD